MKKKLVIMETALFLLAACLCACGTGTKTGNTSQSNSGSRDTEHNSPGGKDSPDGDIIFLNDNVYVNQSIPVRLFTMMIRYLYSGDVVPEITCTGFDSEAVCDALDRTENNSYSDQDVEIYRGYHLGELHFFFYMPREKVTFQQIYLQVDGEEVTLELPEPVVVDRLPESSTNTPPLQIGGYTGGGVGNGREIGTMTLTYVAQEPVEVKDLKYNAFFEIRDSEVRIYENEQDDEGILCGTFEESFPLSLEPGQLVRLDIKEVNYQDYDEFSCFIFNSLLTYEAEDGEHVDVRWYTHRSDPMDRDAYTRMVDRVLEKREQKK